MTPMEIYDRLMADYREDCRYLTDFQINSESIDGRFSVRYCSYLNPPAKKTHLYASEVIVLYEQITYIYLANLFINEWQIVDADVYFTDVLEGRTLIRSLYLEFKEQIQSDDFCGRFEAKTRGKKMDLYILDARLDLENGAQSLQSVAVTDLRGLADKRSSGAAS